MAEAQPISPRMDSLPLPVAVGLARCSGDDQQHSVGDQRAETAAWAHENGLRLLNVFEDEAISGSELDRPGIRRLMKFLHSTREKGTLVVWKRNRLARPDDPRDGLILERQIERAGWTIKYLHGAQVSGNALMDTLMGAIEHHQSGEFLKSLATDVLRGQLRRALEGGFLVGSVPYGFSRQVTTVSGTTRTIPRRERFRRAPGEKVRWVEGDPDEIEIVRRMFERVATEKVSLFGLAGELNAESIPSPQGGVWGRATIRSILSNPTYVGEFVWNKRTHARFCRLVDRKATQRAKGSEPRTQRTSPRDQVRIKNHHVALVEQEQFDKVNVIMAQRGNRRGGARNVKHSHPLSRKIFCAQCGSSMGVTRFDKRGSVYCCNGYRRARICQCYMIMAASVEVAVLRKLKEAVAPSLHENLRTRVLEVLRARLAADAPTVSVARLERERKAINNKINRALDNMGVVGPAVAQRVAGKINEWTARVDELSEEIARAKEREVVEVDLTRAADDVVSLLEEIAGTPEDVPREELSHLFRKTVERVDLRFAVDPAKAHRKKGRHSCVGGEVRLTSLFEEATSVLPGGNRLVSECG